MSNRLTFSLASLIVLLAFGLVFVAAPAMAATFPAGAEVPDQEWKQGQSDISITFPTATAEAAGALSATLAIGGGTAFNPGDALTGVLENLTFTFDAATGVGKLEGDNAHNAITALTLVTYTVAEVGGTAAVLPAFAVEIIAADDLMFPAGTDIKNISLIVGTPYSEVLPAAVGGVEPLTYSIAGTLPDGMNFTAASRLLTGIPTTVFSRAVLTYTVTDNAPTTPVTETLRFTIAVAARPMGPSFAIDKVPDKAYTKGHMITAYTLPAADDTYAVGDVTYALRELPTGLSFDATSRMLTGTPDPTRIGATTARYTATDTAGNVASVPFKITVNPVVAVTTDFGDEDHELGRSFDAIAVTPSGGTGDKTVAVTGLPAGLTFDATEMEITGDPTAIGGPTTVAITATDTLGAMGTSNIMITVKAVSPPLGFSDVIVPKTYEVGTPITPEILPMGTGGVGSYTYTLTGLPAGITFDPATRVLRGTPTAAAALADYDYVISDSAFSHIPAADRTADHTPNTIMLPISITVTAPTQPTNNAPDFGDATVDNIVATSGVAIDGMFLPEATDADGDTLTYSIEPALPAGLTFTPATRSLTGTPTVARMAETAYTYMVDDGNEGTATLGFFITVNAAPPPADPANMPPAFADSASIDNIVATVGMEIEGVFLPEATDPDGDSVFHWISPTLPRGLTFNYETRALTGTPSAAMSQTAYTYTASNSGGSDTIGFFITVNAAPVTPQPPANMPPAFADSASIDNIVATSGVGIQGMFLPEATDADGDTLTYSISPELPKGLTFTPATRSLTGTPTVAMMAETAYTYMVDDGNGGSDTIGFFITVNPEPNVAPVFKATTPVAITGMAGVAIETVDVSATDANSGDTLTYSWDVDEAALGLALDTAAGMISGTPKKAHVGTHPVTVSDGTASATLTVTITISGPNVAPDVKITTTAPTEPQTDSFAIAYTATDANAGDTVTVEVTHTVSPDGTMGYTVDAAAGMATIMQAADSPIAVVTVTVTATDPGGLSDSDSIEVTFAAKAAIPKVDVPGAVTNLTATPGDGQVVLTWVAPADGGAVVSYEYSMNAGVSWMDIADSTAAMTSYTVMGLTNGQTYSFIVRAENTAGPGGASNEISATPKQAPPAAPAAPANFTATAGQEKATLQWTVVEGATYQYRKKSGTATFKDDGTDYMDIAAADLKPVTGSTTMKMFEVTGLTGGTAYTFEVRVKASGSVSAGAPSSDTATPTSAPTLVSTDGKLTGFSVSAESYVLLVRSKATVQGIPASVTDAQIIEWAGMPNLQALFYSGGSLQLSRNKTPKLDHDAKADTDARDAAVRDLILTEVMWARNTALIGKAGELDHQWIEIYNPLKVAVGGVTVETKAGRPPLSTTGDVVQLDMLSNQVGAGWAFEGLGQDGSDDMNNLTNDTKVNFVSMYRKNRAGDKHGWVKGHWSSSTEVAVTGHIGTPGRGETKTAVVVTATPVPRSPFVINEFGIGTSDGEDWVELRNVTESAQNLKNLLLTSVTGLDTEAVEFHFHDKGLEVPAKGVVLIASTDPLNSDIAAGVNLEIAADNQAKRGATSLYVVRDFDLPTGKFNLILRKDYNNKPGDFLGKALNKVIDAIGSLKVDKDTANFNTDFWPLNGTGGPHGDVIEGLGQDFKAGTVYIRKNAGGGTGEHHLGKIGYIGVGYDRTASATDENGGTPGYDNGASKDKIAGLTTGDITISEIMIDTGPARQSLPQWIEFHNSSMTQAVNLNGWKLHIENAANGTGELETNTFSATLTLGNVTISPNQTVLIVTNTGRVSDPDHFPSTRVINLWTTKAHRDALEMTRRTDPVLSATGFNVTLADKDNVEVDSAGNLDGNRRTRDDIAWALPVGEDDGRRSSLIRVYDAGVAIDGTMEEAWVLADQTNLAFAISQTYYGDSDDFGTPGFKAGGPLPVSLSKFRPERLDDGSIRIAWVTESELNNAGFNILRSEKRDGEFKQINTKLIAGKGTTSERSTYTYTDPSAKPNVVYYYQIQDVSIDGKVTTLRETRLKGHISAAGKLTTTWGELKALQ